MIIGLTSSRSAVSMDEQRRRLGTRRCSRILEDNPQAAMGMLSAGDTLVVADVRALGDGAAEIVAVMESVAVMGATLIVTGQRGHARQGGRPKADREAIADALARYDAGERVPEICAATGIGRSTLYRAIAERGNPPDT